MKDINTLEDRSGWKAGFDINTQFGEVYGEYRKTKKEYDLFGKAYGKAIWNDTSTFHDNEYIAGVKGGISW